MLNPFTVRRILKKGRPGHARIHSMGTPPRGAVKFNLRLHPEEIEHLLRSLERTDVPRLCPHGRPIYLEISRDSLDDRFERT